jgi:N-acetylmuramoyl-L-alanine amidase
MAFLLGIGYVSWLTAETAGSEPTAVPSDTAEVARAGPTRTLRPTSTPQKVQTTPAQPATQAARGGMKIGVVAGHWQHDPGAVCPDGLQEVHLNLDVASRVVAILQHEGFDAELMPEFSGLLNNYRASAFVSIHADTCAENGLSGFKVARVAASAIPEQEDRLVACLIQEYGKATGLPFHQDSITFDMTDYHAFREINPNTPGAIIELGFMYADRELLTEHSSDLAQAVAQGILCFLKDS